MKLLHHFFILGLLFSSCTKTTSIMSLFEKKENVSHRILITPSLSCSPYGLSLYDSVLILIDTYDGRHISLFDVQNQKELHRCGLIGNGPGELSDWVIAQKYHSEYYNVYDMHRKQLFSFPVLEMLKDSMFRPTQKHDFINILSFLNVIQINDSLFIGELSLSESIYGLANHRGELLFSGHHYPNDGKDVLPKIKYHAYQGRFYSNPENNNLLLHVGFFGAVFNIMKIENQKIHILYHLPLVLPKYRPFYNGGSYGVFRDNNSIIGCVDVSVTKDYIYVLYADKPEVNNQRKTETRCSDIILMFDWKGQAIMCYQSDVDLYQIHVSDDNQVVYAIIMNPEAQLVKLEL
jgi:hypothetical protein